MPFTFAHPAIVLPFGKWSSRSISLSAMVVGSMAPDFEYFLRWQLKSMYSHTIPGLFWFDLPLALAVWYLYFRFVHQVLIKHLPNFLQSRFIDFSTFNWKERLQRDWWVLALNILFGASTHLLWDNFTHHTGYFVTTFPILQQHLWSTDIPIYKVLQHASTFIGMSVICIAIWLLPKSEVPLAATPKLWFWGSLLLISTGILMIRFWSWEIAAIPIGIFIVSSISAFSMALLLQSVFVAVSSE